MKLDDRARLQHMLDSTNDAISFIGNFLSEELEENRLVLNAIVRALEIVGEAAAQISKPFRDAYPDVAWAQIIGMRNRVVHAYFDIDYELVYSTVKSDLPVLLKQITLLIHELE